MKRKSNTFSKFRKGVREVGSTFASIESAVAPFLL